MSEKKKMSKGMKFLIVLLVILLLILFGLFKIINSEPVSTGESTKYIVETQGADTRKESIGKSNKNFDEFEDGKINLSNMLNDVTGNWKLLRVTTTKSIEEYALDYYNKYFETNNQIHWIVNFTTNTTTKINCLGNYLSITTYEYVDKEELDAKKIGSGMILTSYTVWLDNGDIEKIS